MGPRAVRARVCTHVSTCARACVQAAPPVPGTWSQFSSSAGWNAQPSPNQQAVSSPRWKAGVPGTGPATGLHQSGVHGETPHPSLRGKRPREPALGLLEADPQRCQQLLSLMFGPGEPDSPSGRGRPVWIKK